MIRRHQVTIPVLLVVFLSVIFLATIACSPAAPSPEPAEEEPEPTEEEPEPTEEEPEPVGGVMRFGISQEPETLDPHVTGQAVTSRMMTNVLATLTYVSPEDGNIYPYLARDWEVNEDGTEFTLYLRDDVVFHDGTPFNAEAVKYSFDRIVDPETASQSAASTLGPYTHSEVIDEYTIKVHFESPMPLFLTFLSGTTLAPVSPTAAEELGLDGFSINPVGAGPFKFVEWRSREYVEIERFDEFDWAPEPWGHQGPPLLDGVRYLFQLENEVRTGAVQAGDTHGAEDVSPHMVATLRENPDLNIVTVPFPGSPRQFMLNTQKAPTDDVNVRKAINYSVDTTLMIERLFFGVYPPAKGPVSEITPGYAPVGEGLYGYDLDRAAEYMQEAGYEKDDDGMWIKDGEPCRLEIHIIGEVGSHESLAEAAQAQLLESGFEVEIIGLARPAWYANLGTGEHNMAPMALWSTTALRVCSALYHSDEIGDGFNWSLLVDPEVDEWIDEAMSTFDTDQQNAILAKVQERVYVDHACTIGVFEQVNVSVFREDVQDYFFNVDGYMVLVGAWLSE